MSSTHRISDLIVQLQNLQEEYGDFITWTENHSYQETIWNILVSDLTPPQPPIDPVIYDLVNLLDSYRFEGYREWLELGMCLKNISPTLLPLWDRLSRNSVKWDPTCCSQKWEKFRILPPGEGLGIGSLHYWAQKDNPEGYQQLINQEADRIIDQMTDPNYDDTVEVEIEKIEGQYYITHKEYIYSYDENFMEVCLEDLDLVGVRENSYIHWFNT